MPGARYIIQGNGSGVALALIDAINKYNERNPGKELVYLNEAAVDPDLTNSKCSFWHFRFDADTTMKMEALSSFMKDQKDIHKVYILGQNYSHGVQVAKYAKEDIKRKRPDIEIVGEDLHPIGQVRDFSPYIAKIKASGADAVVTGNWGADLSLLVKAAVEAGYHGQVLHLLRRRHRHADGAGHERRRQGLRHRLRRRRPDGRRVRQGRLRLQGEVQRRLLHRRDHPHARGDDAGDGPGQVDRSGQGRLRHGRPEVEERVRRRRRDAQEPTTSCSSRSTSASGRRPTRRTRTASRTPA